jgi:hypothetical protein
MGAHIRIGSLRQTRRHGRARRTVARHLLLGSGITGPVAAGEANDVALVYSQAAIEHIWYVADLWRAIIGMTKPGSWHSHRTDLADHGCRESNYIEMLEWSPLGYWLTTRFVPGAINRWRASLYMASSKAV